MSGRLPINTYRTETIARDFGQIAEWQSLFRSETFAGILELPGCLRVYGGRGVRVSPPPSLLQPGVNMFARVLAMGCIVVIVGTAAAQVAPTTAPAAVQDTA